MLGPASTTDRLLLWRWRDADRAPFAPMNADPVVMELFPNALTAEQSNRFVDAVEAHFERSGFGLWAEEVVGDADFIGFVGLWPAALKEHFTPAVEIGWRLAVDHWGRGYATEGAQAALRYGFERMDLTQVVSFTAAANSRSQRVMQRIGMHRDPAHDFDHPSFPANQPQRRHVLYRPSRNEPRP